MILRELFYLQKSDRKVVVALLCTIAVALGVIFLAGGSEETNGLTPADTLAQRRDTARKHYYRPPRRQYVHKPYHRVDTLYIVERAPRRTDSARVLPQASHHKTRAGEHKIGAGEHVVLNTADTAALMTIPGIGPYYARRIFQYGQRLGGYVSVSQIDEIGDIPEEAKAYLRIESPSPQKLNVNRLSLEALRRHPYINFYQAKAITDYRRLNGPIRSLSDLSLSRDFPQEAIDRLLPYVEY